MKEFEELEGFTDQNFDDETALDENDDDDGTLRPPVASNLSNSDVYYEVCLRFYAELMACVVGEKKFEDNRFPRHRSRNSPKGI